MSHIIHVAVEILSLVSRFLNIVVFAGQANMNLSARAHICAEEGSRKWGLLRDGINALFFWQHNHCAGSWGNRVRRADETKARTEALNE